MVLDYFDRKMVLKWFLNMVLKWCLIGKIANKMVLNYSNGFKMAFNRKNKWFLINLMVFINMAIDIPNQYLKSN